MNWLDIILLVVIAVFVFLGFKTGIIGSILAIIGLIVGIILAGRYYIPLSERLTFIPYSALAKVVAFILILAAVLLIARLVAWLLKWLASALLLGWVNHLGGAIFGLVFGALICSALLAVCVNYFGLTGAIADSRLAAILLDRFAFVLALLPDEFDRIRSFFQ